MAYVTLEVRVDKRDRRALSDQDSVALTAIKVGGASGQEINASNVVVKDNSQVLTNKTMDGASNTFANIPGNALASSAVSAILQQKNTAAWGVVLNKQVSTNSTNVTASIESAAQTKTATVDDTAKGILMTGIGTGGAGIENYKVQLRNSTSLDPIDDGANGESYAELTNANAALAGSITTSLASDQVAGTDTTFLTDFQAGDGLRDHLGNLIGYVASVESDTAMTLATLAAEAVSSDANYLRRRYVLTFRTLAGNPFTFAEPTNIDFLFAEVFDMYNKPWKADLYGFSFVDVIGVSGTHQHSAADITSGQLSTDRFSAYADLVAEAKIGTASDQVAAGNHQHAYSELVS